MSATALIRVCATCKTVTAFSSESSAEARAGLRLEGQSVVVIPEEEIRDATRLAGKCRCNSVKPAFSLDRFRGVLFKHGVINLHAGELDPKTAAAYRELTEGGA